MLNQSAHTRNTAPARAEALKRAAERAVDDPAKLARADRIVRTAVSCGRLDPAEYIRRLVAEAPPLSTEQIQRLRDLLPPLEQNGARAA